jgi:DNA primase
MAWLRQASPAPAPGETRQLSSEQVTRALTALAHLARRRGFTVERGGSSGATSWASQRIRIPDRLSPRMELAALAHQLGHVLLHEQTARADPAGVVACQGLRKVEADSVAYLTAVYLGTDTAAAEFPYVGSWAGTDPRAHPAATIETTASRVLAAAAIITAHLDKELFPGRPAPAAQPRPRRARPAAGLPAVPGSDLIPVIQAAQAFFRDRLAGSWVPSYLAGRGIGPGGQDLWQAGHAPASWDALTRHLRSLGYPDPLLEAAGVARRSRRDTLIDMFRNRAMLPVRSPDGTITAFIGRAPSPAGPGVPKYLNSPQTSLYDKSTTLFGLWEARDALAGGAQAVIVEGPLDAIAVTTAGHGRYAGVAPCGTALTAGHARELSRAARLQATGVLVAFDPDQAGHRGAVRAYHLLAQFTTATTAVTLPAGQDPAQILAENDPGHLLAILAAGGHPLADLVTDAELQRWKQWLNHPEGQISALRATAPVIAAMPPAHVARQVARVSDRLGMDYATVTEAVTAAVPEVIRRTSRRSPADKTPDRRGALSRPPPRRNARPLSQRGRGRP